MKFDSKKSIFLGIILTIIAYIFFSASSAFVKMVAHDIPTIEVVFFQTFVPLIMIIPLILKNNIKSLKPKSISAHFVRDVMGIASYFCYFYAIKYIGLVDATVLTYTAPFYIPIIWSLWTKDKIKKEIWWSICLGFIGILIILKPGTEIFHMASFIGILAGILSALALTSIGVLNVRKESLTNTLFYYFLVSSVIAFPFMWFDWINPTTYQLYLLMAIGVTNFFGQILLTKAYTYGTASFLSPLSYTIVIFTAFISWIFFKNPPGWISLLGILFIVIGGTLTVILKKKPKNIQEVFEEDNKIKKN